MTGQCVVLDLEMNPVSSRANREVHKLLCRETVEIGAVKLDLTTYKTVDRFHCYVKPEYNELITTYISKLTGIVTSDVCAAPVFKDALSALEQWIGGVPTQVYSWSLADLKQFQDECAFKKLVLPSNLANWIDCQGLYRDAMGLKNNSTPALHKAAAQFGITLNSQAHSALYDAEITAELLGYILSGEYQSQKRLLQNAVLRDSDRCACSIGDSCGAALQLFLRQLSNA